MAYPDLSDALYSALTGNATISAGLASYNGAPAVFTRRPVPSDSGFPICVTAGYPAFGDEDFLDDPMPVIVRDVAFYGHQPDDYRTVESLALAARDLFHRQRTSLSVSGWSVVDIRAAGPIIAPTDDDAVMGRLVRLTIRLTQT